MLDGRVGGLGLGEPHGQPMSVERDVFDSQADFLTVRQPVVVPARGCFGLPGAARVGEEDQRFVAHAAATPLPIDVGADGPDVLGLERAGLALGPAPAAGMSPQNALDPWVVGRARQILQVMRVTNGGHRQISGAGSPPPSVPGLRAVPCQIEGDGIWVGGQGRDIVFVAPRQEARELVTIPPR